MTQQVVWGRRLQVDLTIVGGGHVRLVDFDSTRHRDDQGLACKVEFTRHVQPEAQPCTVQVWNLAPLLQKQLYMTWAMARQQSYITKQAARIGRVVVRAGRDANGMRVVVDDVIVRVYPGSRNAGAADVVTVIEAEDGRLEWDNLFADSPNPLIAMSKIGTPPGPTPGPALPVYSGSGGNTEPDLRAIIEALGYTPVQRGDTTVWIPIGGTAAFPPVALDGRWMPPLAPEGESGVREIQCQYDSIFVAGHPAILQGRTYAIDEIVAALATHEADTWTAQLSLRAEE